MTWPELSDASRRRWLGARHRLMPSTRTDDVPTIADSLLAVHSTDPVSVYLSILARMRRPALQAVDEALYGERSLVRQHAMRRTLWVATVPVAATMHHACTTKLAILEQRRTVALLATSGVAEPEAWLTSAKQQVTDLVRHHGPLTTRQIGQALPELALPLALAPGKHYAATQGAHSRVVTGLGFDGVLMRAQPGGGWPGTQYAWATLEDWSPALYSAIADPGAGEEAAQRDLARRWLARFGPGTTRDLSWYAGWTLTQTRRALASLGAVAVQTTQGDAWLLSDQLELDEPDDEPWVALLPSLDATIMGWKERGFYLSPGGEAAWDRNGNAGPTVWVDGQVVGAWAQRPDGSIHVHYFQDVPAERRARVAARAADVREWLGDTRFSWRFPGAINARLVR